MTADPIWRFAYPEPGLVDQYGNRADIDWVNVWTTGWAGNDPEDDAA